MTIKLTERARAALRACPDCGTEHIGGPCGFSSAAERFATQVFDFKPSGSRPTDERGIGTRRVGRGRQRKWDRRLERYAELRAQGIRPAATNSRAIEQADRISQKIGRPFDGATDGGLASAEKAGHL